MPRNWIANTRITWSAPKAPPDKYILQGHKASKNEWHVAQALDRVRIEYKFQEAFFGGRRLRGGVVVDFIVYTRPLPTPLWVHGEYWHRNKRTLIDEYQYALIFYMMRGQLAQPEIIWGRECDTYEKALATIRRKFQ